MTFVIERALSSVPTPNGAVCAENVASGATVPVLRHLLRKRLRLQ